jgi:nitrogenase molybdenum-iron protein alpha/beta subunit
MSKLFLLFSHYVTTEQFEDARQTLGITDFIRLPENLQERFSNVPADLETINEYLKPILDWIDEHCSDKNDYILIQGDFGATYFLVDYCKKNNYATPMYATTERKSVEEVQEDGSIKTQRIFKHKRFRLY